MAYSYTKGWYLGFPESKTGFKRYFPRERTLIDPARYYWDACDGYSQVVDGPNGEYKFSLVVGKLTDHHNEDPGDLPFYWLNRAGPPSGYIRAAGSFKTASPIRDCYYSIEIPPPFGQCLETTLHFSSYSEGAYADYITVEPFLPPNPEADWLTYFIGRSCTDPIREDALSSIMPTVLDDSYKLPCDFGGKTWTTGEIVPTAYDPYTERKEVGKYFVADTSDLRPGSGVGYDVQRGGKYCWMPFIRFAKKITWTEWSDYLTLDVVAGSPPTATRIISQERKQIVWEWDDSIGEWVVTTNLWYCGSKTQENVTAVQTTCKGPGGPPCPPTPTHTEDSVAVLTAQHLTASPFTYYDLDVPGIPIASSFSGGQPTTSGPGGPYYGGRTPEVITPASFYYGDIIERTLYSDFLTGDDEDSYVRTDYPYDFIAPFCHGDV